jgi:hypothetical protein
MAKYGTFLYGTKKYGERVASQVYYHAKLSAWASDYQTIYLSWEGIVPDPADPAPTHWKIIRNQVGVSNSPDLGETVIGDVITTFPVAYYDVLPATFAGREVYYSIWVFNGVEWIRCGDAAEVVVLDEGSLTSMLRGLPAAWLNETTLTPGDALGGYENTQFTQFLSGLAFAYDKDRAHVSLVSSKSDYRLLPKALLGVALSTQGMPYEPTLGDFTNRSLYRVGHIVNSMKGTTEGVTQFVSALTNWGSNVTLGHNLFLNYNDSSFEDPTAIPRWNTTWWLGNYWTGLYTDAGFMIEVLFGRTITPPVTPLVNPDFLPRTAGLAVFSFPGTGAGFNGAMYSPQGTAGIPVKPLSTYLFTGYVMRGEPATTGEMQVTADWYDKAGNNVGSFFGGIFTVTDAWTKMSYTLTAPAGAHFVSIGLFVMNATLAGAKHVVDQLQLAEATYGSVYEDARLVKIQVDADRTNLIPNPGFEGGAGFWWVNEYPAVNFAQAANPPAGVAIYGTSAGRLTFEPGWFATAANLYHQAIQVNPGVSYTFSCYVTGPAGATLDVQAYMSTSNAQLVTSGANTFFLDPNVITQKTYTLTGTRQRVWVTSQSPTPIADDGPPTLKHNLYFTGNTAGDDIYIDGVLLEQSPYLLPFFQGNGAPAPASPLTDLFINTFDCTWERGAVTNFIPNQVFDTTTGWTAGVDTTIASVTAENGVTPETGTYMLKVSTSAEANAAVSTVVYLEDPVVGENITVTLRVAGYAGSVYVQDAGQVFHHVPYSTDWTTVHNVHTVQPGETSYTLHIYAFMPGGPGHIYIDSAQAERGSYSRAFVDPVGTHTTTRPNRTTPGVNVTEAYLPLNRGGRSYFFRTYADKLTRLKTLLPEVLPMGSTFSVISGDPSTALPPTPTSLLTNGSFQNSLTGATEYGTGVVLSRFKNNNGMEDLALSVNGPTSCYVTAGTIDDFGVRFDKVAVTAEAGYYATAAIMSAQTGTLSLTVDWLDITDVIIWSTTSSRVISPDTRWQYFAVTDVNLHDVGVFPLVDLVSAVSARVTVSLNSTTHGGFSVDRVIFRQ